MTFRTATTTAVGVTLFATMCAAASVDEVNKRFMAGKVSDQIANAGILIHQFGTTDDSYPGNTMWQPCNIEAGTCWFNVPGIGQFDDRVSCSITSYDAPKTTVSVPNPSSTSNVPPAGSIGLFSYEKGGVILNPSAVNMTCSYQGDGGTMTRVADARGGGCGCQNTSASQWSTACIEPQLHMPGGCDNHCPTPADPKAPWLSCHQCAWGADQLSSMMQAQRAGTAAGALIYNEILVQAAPWRENPSAFIDAFFYPKGSDPSSEAGETKTRAAYAAFTKEYPDSNVPLLVLDAAYPLHPTGNGPFTVAPAV